MEVVYYYKLEQNACCPTRCSLDLALQADPMGDASNLGANPGAHLWKNEIEIGKVVNCTV